MENTEARLYVPAICLAEIGMAIERKRVGIPSLEALLDDLTADPRITIEPIDASITIRACRLTKLSDIHDRLIVAVAQKIASEEAGTTLVTADREIFESQYVSVLWAHARK